MVPNPPKKSGLAGQADSGKKKPGKYLGIKNNYNVCRRKTGWLSLFLSQQVARRGLRFLVALAKGIVVSIN